MLGTAEWGERFVCAVARPAPLRGPVPPREVERRRPAPAGELRRDLCLRSRFTWSSIRRSTSGTGTRFGWSRATTPRDRLRRRPRRRRAPLGRAGGELPARRGSRRRALRRAREPRARAPDRGEVGVPIQLGGGLRDAVTVAAALAAGAERVVLGTAALAEPELVEGLAAEHGERIVVAARRTLGPGRGRGLGA